MGVNSTHAKLFVQWAGERYSFCSLERAVAHRGIAIKHSFKDKTYCTFTHV